MTCDSGTERPVGLTLQARRAYEFKRYVAALCVQRDTHVTKLGVKLWIDPLDLLWMIHGKTTPTKAVIDGLARELRGDVGYLEKLAEVIEPSGSSE
jgi:hypothetical protein